MCKKRAASSNPNHFSIFPFILMSLRHCCYCHTIHVNNTIEYRSYVFSPNFMLHICIRDNRIMHINTPRCLYICSSGCQKWRNIYQTVQRLVGQIDNVHGKETRHHKRGLMLFLRLSPLNRTRRWFHIKSIWILKFVPFKRHHLSLQNNKKTHSISQTKWKFNRNLAMVRNPR